MNAELTLIMVTITKSGSRRKQGSRPWSLGAGYRSLSAALTHQCHGYNQVLRAAGPQPTSDLLSLSRANWV